MNRLSLVRRTQIIGALVEGNSIRSTERMTNTHRDTIMRLMVEVGTGCEKLHNAQMRNLSCNRIQVDEIWSYVKVKQAHIAKGTPRTRIGDQWTFGGQVAKPDRELGGPGFDGAVVCLRARSGAGVFRLLRAESSAISQGILHLDCCGGFPGGL